MVTHAVASAKESVELADRSGDAGIRMINRTILADALHQAGRWEESAAFFREAEAMQAEMQPEYPRLYSVRGYRYCDYLLSRSSASVGSAGDHLSLGRAHLGLAQASGDVASPDVDASAKHLDRRREREVEMLKALVEPREDG